MTLVQLLNKANEGYDDHFLSEYFHPKTGKLRKAEGDGLARFIVIEISETFDAEGTDLQQVDEAIRVMVQAQVDIRGVLRFLRGGRRDAFWKEQEEKEMKK
jgi:hypothetical protein